MKAIILAGGFGTRMRPLTFSTPKPLLSLVNKPIIMHILDYLNGHGISEVVITTNYLRDVIQDYVGSVYKGMKIHYPIENAPLGTAGCVKNVEDILDDTFIVIQGDGITDIDLSHLIKSHKYHSGIATIATYFVDEPWKYGVVEQYEDGRVKQFKEKPPANECVTNQANTGIYVLEPEALDFIPSNTKFDFAKNLFPLLLERDSIFAVDFNKDYFWVDVGQPADYRRAHNWIMERLENHISDTSEIKGNINGAVVLGENVKIGKDAVLYGPVVLGDNVSIDDLCVIRPFTSIGSDSVIHSRSRLDGSILFRNNTVGVKNSIQQSLIGEDCVIKTRDVIQEDVILGANCTIESNVYILEGSRVWPGMNLSEKSIIDGTLKKFIQTQDNPSSEIKWILRELTSQEAFYFNKKESNHIVYTGFRARSLEEFNNLIREVDMGSLDYHFRGSHNDFSDWVEKILGMPSLADDIRKIKSKYCNDVVTKSDLRKTISAASAIRLRELIEEVIPPGYA